jgi:threonine/homoserine/homoserine lactone efflux protein
METAAALLGISALVFVTPGDDTVLTIRNTRLGGRVVGWLSVYAFAVGRAGDVLVAFGIRLASQQR